MHYFVAEMVPLVVLLPLDEVTKFEIPIEEETTATSTDLELEVLGGINNDATDPKEAISKLDQTEDTIAKIDTKFLSNLDTINDQLTTALTTIFQPQLDCLATTLTILNIISLLKTISFLGKDPCSIQLRCWFGEQREDFGVAKTFLLSTIQMEESKKASLEGLEASKTKRGPISKTLLPALGSTLPSPIGL
ncbi:hypothetical protein M9H77_07602 [Catharanthus roseus]|uniref:Uncharacterized protein n=1 Tax=Catharanthus roseus TaxID=4058 RepID=A0ACC0BVN1_CATRO|nr:hypothetical protein M9H77_07602 [Catharanthus roseus]